MFTITITKNNFKTFMSDNATLLETIEDLTFASIDLGSNSFHMIIGRQENGQLVVVDRMREAVRLSEGLVKKDLVASCSRSRD